MTEDDVVIRLDNVSVEIPLRGLKNVSLGNDPRILLRNKSPVLRALDGVNLEVHRGERIGIVGGNGNGKTTLLKVVGGMLPVSSGFVDVRGSIRSLLHVGAGMIFALTGRQNVRLRHSLLDIRSLTPTDYAEDVAEFAELGAFFDMPVGTYSPGMQSRLQFAMNTVEPADILLLDEWMGVADRAFQQKAQDRLVEYIAKNEGFLFASHNDTLLNEMTDRKITLEMGRIVES
ncbi:ATP-binding cassette domain-containing protein [Mesorhizobium loti R88b]|uniref:ATP-binding cassette domain-containing protein n=1 Tax=Mesorhizobium loti R88b TaxID=935548 RepID=A0A6M7X3F1_RHILI|nr:ATP-binding cassette domain-containing protein [Mesorhizobium loti R88b]